MLFTIHSVCMALLSAWLLLRFLHLIMYRRTFSKFLHADFLTAIVWLVFFRLFMPFNFVIGFPIPWDRIYVMIDAWLDRQHLLGVTGYGWLSWIWLAGASASVIHSRLLNRKNAALTELILTGARETSVSQLFDGWLGPDYTVYISPNIKTSFVMGWTKAILLPDKPMTEREREFILMHEVQHLVNEDGVYIYLLRILTILYWWLPPIYNLGPAIFEMFYEIRVDRMVSRRLSAESRLDYAETLVKFSHLATKGSYPELTDKAPAGTMGFGSRKKEQIEVRMMHLLGPRMESRKAAVLPYVIIALVVALSSFLVLMNQHMMLF